MKNGLIIRYKTFLYLSLIVIFFACKSKVSTQNVDENLIRSQVDSAMAAYQDAIAKHDGKRIATFYSKSSEFEVIANGKFINYNDWVKSNIDFYSGIREVRGGFSNLHSIILAPDAVLISGARDQTTVDTANVSTRRVGAASWIWIKQEGRWSIIHISTHYSEEPID